MLCLYEVDWKLLLSLCRWLTNFWGYFNPASEGHWPIRWIYLHKMAESLLFRLYNWFIIRPIVFLANNTSLWILFHCTMFPKLKSIKFNRFWCLLSRKVTTLPRFRTTYPLRQPLGSIQAIALHCTRYNVKTMLI